MHEDKQNKISNDIKNSDLYKIIHCIIASRTKKSHYVVMKSRMHNINIKIIRFLLIAEHQHTDMIVIIMWWFSKTRYAIHNFFL